MDIVHGVAPQKVLELRQSVESKDLYLAFKRIFDFSLSFTLILLFLPFMAIIYILIKFTSPGPPIFKQVRIGSNGDEFVIYKFRTMHLGENNDIYKFVSEEEKKNNSYNKTKDDPRITPFGKYLRKTSIDELPQLFNVLFGDMSLVGPRPMLDYYLSGYPQFLVMRSVVKPGMTGLWQIKNRANSVSIFDMIHYDLEYIDNISLYTDIKILLLTIPTVLKCEGAV